MALRPSPINTKCPLTALFFHLAKFNHLYPWGRGNHPRWPTRSPAWRGPQVQTLQGSCSYDTIPAFIIKQIKIINPRDKGREGQEEVGFWGWDLWFLRVILKLILGLNLLVYVGVCLIIIIAVFICYYKLFVFWYEIILKKIVWSYHFVFRNCKTNYFGLWYIFGLEMVFLKIQYFISFLCMYNKLKPFLFSMIFQLLSLRRWKTLKLF